MRRILLPSKAPPRERPTPTPLPRRAQFVSPVDGLGSSSESSLGTDAQVTKVALPLKGNSEMPPAERFFFPPLEHDMQSQHEHWLPEKSTERWLQNEARHTLPCQAQKQKQKKPPNSFCCSSHLQSKGDLKCVPSPPQVSGHFPSTVTRC